MPAPSREPDPEKNPRKLEPIDPKAASRAIGRHLERRRKTEKRRKTRSVPRPAPAAEAAPAPAPPPGTPAESGEAAEAGSEAPEVLSAEPISDRDLVAIMEHTPTSLMEAWIRVQAGEEPEAAVQVSKAEVEFLLLKRNLMD